MMKKSIVLLVAVAAIGVFTAVCWTCSGRSEGRAGSRGGLLSRQHERDCEAEYRAIADSAHFYSAAGGVAACDTFLSHFQYQRCAHNDEVREMRASFLAMAEALSKSYYSFEQFRTETGYLSQQLAGSPRVVRDTWARLLHEEDSLRLRSSLVSLTSHDFAVYLNNYAHQVCERKYGKGLWRMKGLQPFSISEPILVEGKAAVECTAIYNVHISTLLVIERTERLTVSGQLGYTPEGRLSFHRNEYSIQ